MQVSSGLLSVEKAVQHEVAASREAWPQIASGLPQAPTQALQGAANAASAGAQALPEPSFMRIAGHLTGPAAGIAGIYENYDQLARHGWQLTDAAIEAIVSGPSTVASFERQNSSLYIDAIYDGHFDLSLIGKDLISAYEKLGGAQAFGAALGQDEVNMLATAYSIPAVRLEPHPQGAATGP